MDDEMVLQQRSMAKEVPMAQEMPRTKPPEAQMAGGAGSAGAGSAGAVASSRSGAGRRRRVGIGVGVGALAAAVGGGSYAVVSAAAPAAPPATPASLSSLHSAVSTTTPSSLSKRTAAPAAPGPLGRRARLGPNPAARPLSGGLYGSVTAAPTSGSSSLTIVEADGSSVTISATAKTKYTKAPAGFPAAGGLEPFAGARWADPPGRPASSTATYADVKVGDDVVVLPTSGTAGTGSPTASTVTIVPPSVQGTVVSLSGNRLVLRDSQLIEQVVHVDSTTSYELGGTAATQAAVVAGSRVVASGTIDTSQTGIDAAVVDVLPAGAAGKVTAVSGSSFTLAPASGAEAVQVSTSSATTFMPTSGTAPAVEVGDSVVVSGFLQADGSLAASRVGILPAGATDPGAVGGPPAAWRWGGFRPGGGPGDAGMGGSPAAASLTPPATGTAPGGSSGSAASGSGGTVA